MIVEYHRPKTIEEALALLARGELRTAPMGGGSALNRYSSNEPMAVVDLQNLGMNEVFERGNHLDLGASVTLQSLLEVERLPLAFMVALQHEATHNLRQVATIAGTLVAASGRSPFATSMLAMDATITIRPGDGEATSKVIRLGDYFPFRQEILNKRLITQFSLPLNIRLVYNYVARTPGDLPIVCVAVARWKSGRTRVVLGGFGSAPSLAMDGPGETGVEVAARSAYSQADDE